MKMIVRVALLGSLFAAAAAFAAPAWVSDQFEITLRSGPSTSNSIQLMIDSGLRLEVLERDADSGYSKVRTPGGTEGWVLSRYLMSEPSAREQLQKLSGQLTSANSRGSSLDTQDESNHVRIRFRQPKNKGTRACEGGRGKGAC